MFGPVVFLWFQILKGIIFKKTTVFSHSQTIGNWRVNFHHFACNTPALFFWNHVKRFHIMHAVGKLNKNHAHIACHCQKHFAQIFYVAVDSTVFYMSKFGNGFHHAGNIGAEIGFDLFNGDFGVFGNVVQKPSRHHVCRHFHVDQFHGRRKTMHKVWVARFAHLPLMR